MLGSERHNCWFSFPRIPNGIKGKYSIVGLSLRPFGIFENDLEIDFNRNFHPRLATQILQCCTRDKNGEIVDQGFFWDLTIGKRIECLLAIVTLGSSSDLSLQLRCLNETCQQLMEIEISPVELASLQHQMDEIDPITIQIDTQILHIRKPTGNDQLEWLDSSLSNGDSATQAIIQTLLCDNEETGSDQEIRISDEWVKAINEAMGEFDPLVKFSLTVHCPHCDKEGHYAISLEEFLLHELYKSQLNLLQTIHCLANHYHWSEQQILSIPPRRRLYYLDLIEKEKTI